MKQGSVGFVGGHVHTLEGRGGVCEAILVEAGMVTLLGSTGEVKRAAEHKHIAVIDLKGETVLPGPIDTHFHLVHTGMDLTAVDLGGSRSIADVLQLIESAVRNSERGLWILGKGLDEFRIREGRPPTAAELDRVSPGNPLFLSDRGIHYCQLNRLAFQAIGIAVGAPGVRTDSGGTPTGQIMEESIGEAWRRLLKSMPKETRRQAILDGALYAASCGITTLHAMEGGDFSGDAEIELLREMQPDLPIRVDVHWNTFDVEAVAKSGMRVIGGDIWLDGSLGSRTAALLSPYADAPGEAGLLYNSHETIEGFMRRALAAGLQVGFHAIGDRAIEQALDCFKAAVGNGRLPDRACRLDHFGLPSREQIRRAAELGVVVATQPTFPYLRGGAGSVYAARLGTERVARAYPLRELVEAGVLVAGGSDSNVLPADVMLAVHSAVNHPNEVERLSVEGALRLYIESAARSTFEEGTKGTLAVGKVGDLIVVDKDPFLVDSAEIRNIAVTRTVVGGSVAYEKPHPN